MVVLHLDELTPVVRSTAAEMVSGRTRRHLKHAVLRAFCVGGDMELAALLLPARNERRRPIPKRPIAKRERTADRG